MFDDVCMYILTDTIIEMAQGLGAKPQGRNPVCSEPIHISAPGIPKPFYSDPSFLGFRISDSVLGSPIV